MDSGENNNQDLRVLQQINQNSENDRREQEKYYNININQIYANIISQIENIRSYVDFTSFRSIRSVSESLVDANTQTAESPKESRCSAFIRLLGLPVFDGTSLYSPGLDVDSTLDPATAPKRTQIANNLCNNQPIIKLLNQRELAPRTLSNLISKQDKKASLLALSTIDIRDLSLPFKDVIDAVNDTPASGADQKFVFQPDISIQTNVVENYKYIGVLAGYLDLLDVLVDNQANQSYTTRPHIIRPLITDPRADLSVTPAKNRMAAPFAIGKKKTQLRDDVYLKRPYIERVIRDRFSKQRSDVMLSDRGKYIIAAALGKENTSKSIFNDIANNKSNSSAEKIQFANFINIIRATMRHLHDSLQAIYPVAACLPNNHTEAKYNWIPMPSTSGLEFGCETLPLTEQISSPANTAKDNEIINKQIEKELSDIIINSPNDKSVDLGDFAITNSSFLLSDFFSPKSFYNDLIESLGKLESQRDATTKKANTAIRSVEIIMGEISGLGLSDILAITAALWYTDKEQLIYLIDLEAAQRMAQEDDLNNEILQARIKRDDSNAGAEAKAVAAFHKNVAKMYLYMAKLYEEISTESNKQTKVTK